MDTQPVTLTVPSDNPLYPFASFMQNQANVLATTASLLDQKTKDLDAAIQQLSSTQADLASERAACDKLTQDSKAIQTKLDEANTNLATATAALATYADKVVLTKRDMTANQIIQTGLAFAGLKIPYLFGAEWENNQKFDCSSFVQKVFAVAASIHLPRTSYEQATTGSSVELTDLQKGDLLFFNIEQDPANKIDHVAIYVGDGVILHTNGLVQGIHTENLADKYQKWLVAARRVF